MSGDGSGQVDQLSLDLDPHPTIFSRRLIPPVRVPCIDPRVTDVLTSMITASSAAVRDLHPRTPVSQREKNRLEVHTSLFCDDHGLLRCEANSV